jgi:pimeloyl-ACP methyl ester carboxylesterase
VATGLKRRTWWGICIAASLLAAPQLAQAQFQVEIPPTPVLSLADTGEYAGDGINPNTGDTTTAFSFRVRYQNDWNRRPEYVEVCFRGPQNLCRRQTGYVTGPDYTIPYETLEQIQVTFTQPGTYTYFFRTHRDWTTRYPEVASDDFSLTVASAAQPPAVLFIPGLQGSRLYTPGVVQENTLWEPNRNADVEKLWLNASGQALTPDIYTRDVIDEAFGYNIYKNFIAFLDTLVTDEVITDWEALPYDWRFDVDADIPAMIAKIEQLTQDSAPSKVTIIAHSNGGLIAKALLQELQDQKEAGDSDLIDSIERVILVATPQLGTPKAIASMLHGFDLDYLKGVVLSEATARRLAEFMPSAFNLLPSATYFERVEEPVVEFDSSVNGFAPFTSLYGPSIDTPNELKSFLTGGNGTWAKPAQGDVTSPNVLQTNFLDAAADNHTEFEQWTPPDHIDVIQIAGWGLDTVKTFKYTAKPSSACMGNVSAFCRNGFQLDYRPVFTVDGDKTVVVPSAIAIQGKQFYLNLLAHNKELLRFRRNREHADILETQPLEELLKNVLTNVSDLPLNISDIKPPVDEENKSLRVSVHSPVSLRVCSELPGDDGQPICTGLEPITGSDLLRSVEDIANSYYMEFGEGKYVGFDATEPHTIILEGEGPGTFDLEIEEVSGETTTATLKYDDVPVIAGSQAQITLETIDTATPLKIDTDGNGTFETSVNAGQQLTPSQLIDSLVIMIRSSNLKRGDKISLEAQLHVIQKLVDDKRIKNKTPVIALLKNVEKNIQKEADKKLAREEASTMVDILKLIRVRLAI